MQIDNDDRNDNELVRRFVTQLVKVRARHVVDLFHKLRTDRERNLAQRTIYNIYTVALHARRQVSLQIGWQ